MADIWWLKAEGWRQKRAEGWVTSSPASIVRLTFCNEPRVFWLIPHNLRIYFHIVCHLCSCSCEEVQSSIETPLLLLALYKTYSWSRILWWHCMPLHCLHQYLCRSLAIDCTSWRLIADTQVQPLHWCQMSDVRRKMFVFLSFESLTFYNSHEQLQPVPASSHSCVPLVASGKAERSFMILSPKARHLTDGRPLSRLGKVHANMTLLSLLHRFSCMASEISPVLLSI